MEKFYTASSQAKELCDEAKAAKAKSKKLNNEVLLKKEEVIRLTEELTSSWRNREETKEQGRKAQGRLHWKGNLYQSSWGEMSRVNFVLGES